MLARRAAEEATVEVDRGDEAGQRSDDLRGRGHAAQSALRASSPATWLSMKAITAAPNTGWHQRTIIRLIRGPSNAGKPRGGWIALAQQSM